MSITVAALRNYLGLPWYTLQFHLISKIPPNAHLRSRTDKKIYNLTLGRNTFSKHKQTTKTYLTRPQAFMVLKRHEATIWADYQ